LIRYYKGNSSKDIKINGRKRIEYAKETETRAEKEKVELKGDIR
jgi:hypothetical protein